MNNFEIEQQLNDIKVLLSYLLYRDGHTPADKLLLDEIIKRLGLQKGAIQQPAL